MRHVCPLGLAALVLVCISLLGACDERSGPATKKPPTRFVKLDSEQIGLDFTNLLKPDASQNIFDYMYFYNGAGVGTADFDGDGLYDLYFAGNQVPDRVYRNIEGIRFQNVTPTSGLDSAPHWSTGVSIVDLDADSKPDIIVSVVAAMSPPGGGQTRVYLNKSSPGSISFVEDAVAWGLDQQGYGSQYAWLDYDRDGDLDAYVLRHSVHSNGTFGARSRRLTHVHPTAGDMFSKQFGETLSKYK